MLSQAGLQVVEKQGYALLWGLYEIPFLNRSGAAEVLAVSDKDDKKKEIIAVDTTSLIKDDSVSLIKRLVVSEDVSISVLGLGVKFMRWASANMMMYVCKKKL